MRKPCGASPGRRAGEKPAPAPITDDGRGWFRTSPEGERCEETSPGAHHGRWARLVSNERPLACEGRQEEAQKATKIRMNMRFPASRIDAGPLWQITANWGELPAVCGPG